MQNNPRFASPTHGPRIPLEHPVARHQQRLFGEHGHPRASAPARLGHHDARHLQLARSERTRPGWRRPGAHVSSPREARSGSSPSAAAKRAVHLEASCGLQGLRAWVELPHARVAPAACAGCAARSAVPPPRLRGVEPLQPRHSSSVGAGFRSDRGVLEEPGGHRILEGAAKRHRSNSLSRKLSLGESSRGPRRAPRRSLDRDPAACGRPPGAGFGRALPLHEHTALPAGRRRPASGLERAAHRLHVRAGRDPFEARDRFAGVGAAALNVDPSDRVLESCRRRHSAGRAPKARRARSSLRDADGHMVEITGASGTVRQVRASLHAGAEGSPASSRRRARAPPKRAAAPPARIAVMCSASIAGGARRHARRRA